IVFDHEDERVVGVGAVGYLIGRQTYRVVVVGNLKFWRVHTETGAAEVAEVVMIIPQQNQIGEFVGLNLLVEFPLPLLVAEEIGVALIEGPEAEIGEFEQFLLRRPRNLGGRLRGARIGESGSDFAKGFAYIQSTQIGVEPIVANREVSLDRGIPKVARAFFAIGTVG